MNGINRFDAEPLGVLILRVTALYYEALHTFFSDAHGITNHGLNRIHVRRIVRHRGQIHDGIFFNFEGLKCFLRSHDAVGIAYFASRAYGRAGLTAH